jgi:Flp pilus assembly pilin Flp
MDVKKTPKSSAKLPSRSRQDGEQTVFPARSSRMNAFRRFLADESAAVTVDWVFLAAAVVFMAIFGVLFLRDPVIGLINAIGAEMDGFLALFQAS